MYREALMRWELVCNASSPSSTSNADGVAAAAWAPTLGRPAELLAEAAGRCVVVYAVQGPADALEVRRACTP